MLKGASKVGALFAGSATLVWCMATSSAASSTETEPDCGDHVTVSRVSGTYPTVRAIGVGLGPALKAISVSANGYTQSGWHATSYFDFQATFYSTSGTLRGVVNVSFDGHPDLIYCQKYFAV